MTIMDAGLFASNFFIEQIAPELNHSRLNAGCY